MTKTNVRCHLCMAEFNNEELNDKRLKACPNCGVISMPVLIAYDVWVKLNWEDIRLLAIYAQRWAATFNTENKGNKAYIDIIQRIVNDLYKYRPNGADGLDASIKAPQVANEIEVRKIRGIPSPFFIKRDPNDGFTH